MNISNQILVVDVNVIIHLEKVGLLDELINDKKCSNRAFKIIHNESYHK